MKKATFLMAVFASVLTLTGCTLLQNTTLLQQITGILWSKITEKDDGEEKIKGEKHGKSLSENRVY